MKIMIVLPDASMHKLKIGPWKMSMREAPLTHTTLAALTPQHPDIELKLVDQSVERIPSSYKPDLLAISAITGCAPRAYKLAAEYRAKGVTVVLGGVHPTILPGEAMKHADAIVVGRAEKSWPQLIEDFRAGCMKKVYREDDSENFRGMTLASVPLPRRDLQKRFGYIAPNTVQATRGCLRDCDFCSVPAVWPHYMRRPVADVIRDIKAIPGRQIVFNDVSLTDDVPYVKELFTAMIPLKKKWGGLVTVDVGKDEELLDLMARAGCSYLLIGFESASQSNLRQIDKNFNKTALYKTLMDQLHSRGISVQGCFVFGFDGDSKSVFRETVDFVNELKIDIPRYSLYTPYPGTKLFWRMLEEKRILSFNWNDYDTMHVVIRPVQMSPDELYDGFKWAYKETFRIGSSLRRLRGSPLCYTINFFGNLTYRIFAHRLYHEARFAQPYTRQDSGEPPALSDFNRIPDDKDSPPCHA